MSDVHSEIEEFLDQQSAAAQEMKRKHNNNNDDHYDAVFNNFDWSKLPAIHFETHLSGASGKLSRRAISRLSLAKKVVQNRLEERTQLVRSFIGGALTLNQDEKDAAIAAVVTTTADNDSINENSILTDAEREKLSQDTARLLARCEEALNRDDIWELVVDGVNHEEGVTIWRSYADVKRGIDTLAELPTIRSETILNGKPEDVYRLFMDGSRVHEYNDNCVELHDIEAVNDSTKINWCATGKFGPFKARDFVTLVHFCDNHRGGYASVAANVEHPSLPPANGYVRSQIQLAATFMQPVPGEPNKTRFVQLTQVGELGGVADSPMAKKISLQLQEKAPIDFCRKFDAALNRPPQPKKAPKKDPPFVGLGNISYEV